MSVRPAKTQIHPVWSESSLSAWRNLGPLATHWAHSEDFDQTGRMPRLIWVFAGCTLILLVLSCRGSHYFRREMLYQALQKRLTPHPDQWPPIRWPWRWPWRWPPVRRWPVRNWPLKKLPVRLDGATGGETAGKKWATSRENVSSEIFDQVRFKPACSATETS